jgi:hypothetical protein
MPSIAAFMSAWRKCSWNSGRLIRWRFSDWVVEELVERNRYEWVGGPEYLAHLESRVSFAPQFVWKFRQ